MIHIEDKHIHLTSACLIDTASKISRQEIGQEILENPLDSFPLLSCCNVNDFTCLLWISSKHILNQRCVELKLVEYSSNSD